jgi:pyrroloquinoline quinone biosynthesis protein B
MDVRFIMLGTAQDGGLPHVGCTCPTCTSAREGNIPRRFAPSAAIVDPETGRAWLIDASPDMPHQLEVVRDALGGARGSGIPLTGILITHVHMGHYWGLGHLGKEGMMPKGLAVIAPPGVARFLKATSPFKEMVEWGAIVVRSVLPGDTVRLADGLAVTPEGVPHREDFSDTVAWVVEGPRERLIYAPDMDHLDDGFVDLVGTMDMAIVDGTFYYADEIPGAMGTVPHPPVETSMVRFQRALEGGTRIAFTHLNHTNPLCDPRSGEFKDLVSQGYGVVLDGFAVDI